MKKTLLLTSALLALVSVARANVLFHFQEVGGNVTMTSSGTINTNNLVVSNLNAGWGGVGIENNGSIGDIDIMGGNLTGLDSWFVFNTGTDASDITTPNGPFLSSDFSWSYSGFQNFATYGGFVGNYRVAGIGLLSSQIVNGLWTTDQSWTNSGSTFASLGMVTGIYSVSDVVTGETITIQVGDGNGNSVPDTGATLALIGGALVGMVALRRRVSA